ncbi:pirin family protein [Pyrinomonas methylaliphatogenes]|uniref:Pirin-related protein n=1 Tax=Pyrinomonas methylaliphatogenes TaxID=454194 RepID=A0A0B6WWP4_9BACT|nr:pirin family protein [Pyrinomonas methylaliphatogenes]CDM65157.1 Pirin-related protein [Pyrinomonas methylaliphatogenes]
MFRIVPAKDRYHFANDWLSTYWLFSFDHYYDPQNVSFGPLRVFNDDVIQPGRGFDMHRHREMEIVTYVLSGALEHRDSTGGRGITRAGEVQRMSAGTGIAHAEFNASATEPVHLLQIWVLPAQKGLTPSYEQAHFTPEERIGKLLPIASGRAASGRAVRIHQDATLYVSTVRPEDILAHELSAGRRAFLYVIEGELIVNGRELAAGDQARIDDVTRLDISTRSRGEMILIDLP